MTTAQLTTSGSATLVVTVPDEFSMTGWPERARRETGTLPLSRLRRVTDHIREHLDKNLTLAQLGAVVYMSPYHFARLFQRSTGLPPHRFVVRARMGHAATLLARPDLSIARISCVVGFRSPSHFSTVFRRIMGATPSEYRTRVLRTSRSCREGGRDGME